ncbi:molybdate ABC transporter substrate-binding protein [Nitratifractor sp.]|uniref:molybdate ABC transporter substrate-binding protein n=1 Tax=Nitratifractor sp. TaxID=2268144 RepID=UPI0025D2BDBB|nr:molybdate ABC transporter substrate-binding protein [Nitratifractor sp.]
MKKFLLLFAALSLALWAETPRLLIFAGSASKPPTQEAARVFTQKTGIPVDLVFGGSGYVLSQMKLTRKGDLYFPGSSDYMEIAKRQHLVDPKSEKIIVYLVPAITVAKGNPKGIHSLEDLTRPGIRVAIANPDGVCLGTYAVEILEKNFTPEQKKAFRKNLINYTASCAKTATAVSLHQVDAVIGWRVFGHWDPRRIETVPIKASRLVRIGYIPIAVSRFSRHPELAKRFIDFLLSPEGRKIFAKYHYFPSAHAAEKWIGAKKPVGGEYKVPKEWIAQ